MHIPHKCPFTDLTETILPKKFQMSLLPQRSSHPCRLGRAPEESTAWQTTLLALFRKGPCEEGSVSNSFVTIPPPTHPPVSISLLNKAAMNILSGKPSICSHPCFTVRVCLTSKVAALHGASTPLKQHKSILTLKYGNKWNKNLLG